MKVALSSNLLHNPFQNRFNDPVTQRLDDMQSAENMIWLRQRDQGHPEIAVPSSRSDVEQSSDTLEPKQVIRFSDVFALVLVLVSVMVLLRVF